MGLNEFQCKQLSLLLRNYRAPKAISKRFIFKGDEARVTRISCANPFFNGLVERKQQMRVNDTTKMGFGLFVGEFTVRITNERDTFLNFSSTNSFLETQIMQFHAMKLANVLFPENFPKTRALRFSEIGKKVYAHRYSEFVKDDNGTLKRRKSNYGIFYSMENQDDRDAFRDATDKSEVSLAPSIVETAKNIGNAGIILSHPEANYHLNGKTPVFFEISEIDLGKIAKSISRLEGTKDEKLAKRSFFQLGCGISFALMWVNPQDCRDYMSVTDWVYRAELKSLEDGRPADFIRDVVNPKPEHYERSNIFRHFLLVNYYLPLPANPFL